MAQFLNVTQKLLEGFSSSLFLFIFTLLLALPLGLLVTFCTTSRFAPLRIIFKFFVWVLRGTPLMLQIFVIFYVPGLLFGFQWGSVHTGWQWFDQTFSSRFLAALAAFAINYAAYFSEIYRGGIQSVPKGQTEAAAVLGMTKSQIFFKVVFLQVVKRIIPPMSNEIITLIKDTSLANVITVTELMFMAQKQLLNGLIWPLFYAGAFYLLFSGLITIALSQLEKKLGYFKV